MNEIKEGVYITKFGKLFTVENVCKKTNGKWEWEINRGLKKRHPIFRSLVASLVENSTGDYFTRKGIKNCEYLGKL